VDLLTGIGPRGARIDASRTKPVSGKATKVFMDWLRLVDDGAGLQRPNQLSAELG
jgi:hypothetical protein